MDKPYLTFKKTFSKKEGYYFDYSLHSFNIESTFNYLYKE